MPALVKPGLGESLPALLERRRGIPPRTTLLVAAALVALGVVVFLVLRDPLDGRTQIVHEDAPVFNMLYDADLVRRMDPRPGELERFETRAGDLRLAVTVQEVELPAYRGEITGILPVHAERHMADLRERLPGFELTAEGKARVGRSPGYQVVFRYGDAEVPSDGIDVFVFDEEAKPGNRAGVLLTFRHEGGSRPRGGPGHARIRAMRGVFRSFAYGTDRPY